MLQLPAALASLAAYRQFIVYVLSWDAAKGKYAKFPIDHRTGHMPAKGHGGAHDPAIWTDPQTAIAAAARLGSQYGVGFVFTEADPFWFLDIDNCLLPDGSGWSPVALQLLAAFPGAAVEVSASGKGLHVFGAGQVPPHGCRNKAFGLEFYTEGRFVALTGTNAQGEAYLDFSYAMPWLVDNYFPQGAAGDDGRPAEWSEGPVPEWRGTDDDDELLRRAMNSQSAAAAFGAKASFRDLFEGNVEMLAKTYPPDNDRSPYNASNADRALAQHLAFWTGKDCARIERLMLRSALASREKWEREDYLPRTIISAIAAQRDVLTDKAPEPLAGMPGPAAVDAGTKGETAKATAVTGATFLTVAQQVELFRGCVYVYDAGRILVPGGQELKPDQFRVMYGGYSFPMDNANERTSRDPYEAFTQNQAYRSPRADSTCFKPERVPGEIVTEAGQSRVNTYWPVDVPRAVGDISPFSNHLAKLLPDERDRLILLSYMAACVQHKGVKFQWAPLIQGVEGNGKTLLTRCVAAAIGKRYVHWPKASKLCAQFNGWMRRKLFYAVEDIYVPSNRIEVIEELKPMITGDDLEIEGKGVDQVTADICGNFMLNSNHKGALPKSRNDRRFCNLFTAQQQASDLARDGMDGNYMRNLYDWLKAGGYAIVSEFLHTWPIPDEFNPATSCQRAPATTSTEEAISESLGGIEQEILEAIAQGLPGFAGGWVSSMALDGLLGNLNASRRVTINKRRDLMASLGFVYHPALKDGRVNTTVLPDGGKPRLYVRQGHPYQYLTDAGAIARAYSDSQGAAVNLPQ